MNYGGGDKTASESLDISLESAKALNQGYTDAFPVVIVYQENVTKALKKKGYAVNLYGRRYYITNYRKFYKCGNYLIQGSCAEILKMKMIEIDEFLTANNCKTRMILCVHDELQFEEYEGEEWVIAKIKEIMEDVPDCYVPIVAEIEKTATNWSEKKPVLELVTNSTNPSKEKEEKGLVVA